jgi:succinate dehydrogenase / fumarate reductase cytochrome b subunit
MTIYGFRHPVMTLSYVAVMGFLFYHLSHGFQSLFQSLGLNDQRWMGRLQWISFALAVLIFIGNSSMPLAVLLGLVGGNL